MAKRSGRRKNSDSKKNRQQSTSPKNPKSSGASPFPDFVSFDSLRRQGVDFSGLDLDGLNLDELNLSGPEMLSMAKQIVGNSPPLGLIERFLAQALSKPGEDTPLEQAQLICYEAQDSPSRTNARKLALKALKICEDCADAYNVLAECSSTMEDTLKYYQNGVDAGRRAIAAEWGDLVEDDAFWDYHPTRPMMRSMRGKADVLWALGKRDESLDAFMEILKLNPNDNQGIRQILVPYLLEMDRDADAEKILKQYDESNCFALYDKSLLAFRKMGDCPRSKNVLKKAVKANPYVLSELTNDWSRRELPETYAQGTEEEAICYTEMARRAWKRTPGATAWLRKEFVNDPSLPAGERPTDFTDVDNLWEIPQSDDVWILTRIDLDPYFSSTESEPGATMNCPQLVSLVSKFDEELIKSETSQEDEEITPEVIWAMIARSIVMANNCMGNRPDCIEFLNRELYESLKDKLEEIEIEAIYPDDAEDRLEEFKTKFVRCERFTGELTDLPMDEEDIWVIDCRQLDSFIPNDDGEMIRPWAFVLVSQENGIIHSQVTSSIPTPEDWESEIEKGLRQPTIGEPHRPGVIVLPSQDHRMMLGTFCERLGITSGLINSELIGMMDELFESLRSHMSGGTNRTPLVRLKGMTHEQLESFFEGVKLFYVQAPWQFTATDSAWKIEFADKPDQPWWAVVMGQNGETYGLAFYEDWHSLHGMLTGEIDGLTADFTTKVSCICLSFDEASVLAGADLDAIEQFEWPIAAPEAYPLLYRIKPNVGIHTPSTGDLKLLESVLRTLPDFIRSGKPDGSVLAKLHDGELQFKITKVNLNDREATPSSRGRNRRR